MEAQKVEGLAPLEDYEEEMQTKTIGEEHGARELPSCTAGISIKQKFSLYARDKDEFVQSSVRVWQGREQDVGRRALLGPLHHLRPPDCLCRLPGSAPGQTIFVPVGTGAGR